MQISNHAFNRIIERTSLTKKEFVENITKYSIPIGKDKKRDKLLFYSPQDDTFFIVIKSQDDTIVTIMPYDYQSKSIGFEALEMARNIHNEKI